MRLLQFGEVELMEFWGSDEQICEVTRVSTGSKLGGLIANLKLLSFLYREDHGSPLEFGGLIFRLYLPIFLARQLVRHRIASYSEHSGRYQEMEMDFYRPDYWSKKSEGGNKQVGAGPLPDDVQAEINQEYIFFLTEVERVYYSFIKQGVALEEARIILPLTTYTTVYCQFNLRSLMNFLRLRMAPDAQRQWKPYVDEIYRQFSLYFPVLGDRVFAIALKIDRAVKPFLRHIWKAEVEAELETLNDDFRS